MWQERIRETSDLTLMCSVIMSIQLLLCEPNQENPVNLRALQMMNNKTATYNEVARDSVICSVHFGGNNFPLLKF